MTQTFVIYSDLSGVEATEDGFGAFATEEDALISLVARLNGEFEEVSKKRRAAKRRLAKVQSQ